MQETDEFFLTTTRILVSQKKEPLSSVRFPTFLCVCKCTLFCSVFAECVKMFS